jgi:hypothetical protein
VSVPCTINKDERFQTWLVGQVGMTLQLFFLSSNTQRVTQPVPLIRIGRFSPCSLLFQQLRLNSYCKLWCVGKDSTCICEIPSLFLDRTYGYPDQRLCTSIFQKVLRYCLPSLDNLLPNPYMLAVYGLGLPYLVLQNSLVTLMSLNNLNTSK